MTFASQSPPTSFLTVTKMATLVVLNLYRPLPCCRTLITRGLGDVTRPKKRGFFRRMLKWTVIIGAVYTGAYYSIKYVQRKNRPTFEGPKKKLVVLGTGWGALSVLHHLEPDQFDVTVVSPRNYFLFTPLLPSVTVGTVECRSIVEPIRKLIRKKHKGSAMKFLEAECVDINPAAKRISCEDKSCIVGSVSKFELDYDILVVAVGATSNTFNTPGVKEHCHFLKEIPDAQKIRNVIIDLVETASIPGQEAYERQRLLHFVVVGGGPTGVEFAAEVRDFLREDIAKIYPGIEEDIMVTLVQSQDHILNAYDKQISQYTEKQFKIDGINLITNSRVTAVNGDEITIKNKQTGEVDKRPYGVCIWSTGLAPLPITTTIIQRVTGHDKCRALLTDKFLRVQGAEGVFALGDCSTIEQELMVRQAEQMFREADANGDGTLSLEEFTALVQRAIQLYPQAEVALSYVKHNIEKLFSEVDTSGDQRVDYKEFEAILHKMDRNLKSLPATAQVASQQGEYLGQLLSNTNGEIVTQSTTELEKDGLTPFKYKHLGSFAYVGDNKAVLQLPIIGTMGGWWTMWLWRAAYMNECASLRTKLLVVGDWTKACIFGRDSSRT